MTPCQHYESCGLANLCHIPPKAEGSLKRLWAFFWTKKWGIETEESKTTPKRCRQVGDRCGSIYIEHIDLTKRYGFNHGRDDGFVQKRLKLEFQYFSWQGFRSEKQALLYRGNWGFHPEYVPHSTCKLPHLMCNFGTSPISERTQTICL